MSADTPVLPALRQELTIIPAPRGDDGSPVWYIFDPVRNAFHTLSRQAVNILAHWRKESADHALKRLKSSYPDMNFCLLYTSPSPRDATLSRMPSSA